MKPLRLIPYMLPAHFDAAVYFLIMAVATLFVALSAIFALTIVKMNGEGRKNGQKRDKDRQVKSSNSLKKRARKNRHTPEGIKGQK